MTHVLETAAQVPDHGPLADALKFRARLMDLTQASHDAALLPETPGGLDLPLRAVLAARMSRICRDEVLAAHYDGLAGDTPLAPLAQPDVRADDARLATILDYVDLVTRQPRDARPKTIDALRQAGVEEGDVVRLAGLVAFVNYQLRVAHVLRVMGASA